MIPALMFVFVISLGLFGLLMTRDPIPAGDSVGRHERYLDVLGDCCAMGRTADDDQ